MRSLGPLTCVALGACSFTPPSPFMQLDGPPPDEMMLPPDEMMMPDAQLCFGAGLGMLCLSSAPTQARTLNGTIDTGMDASCDEIIDVTGTPACVIAGTTVDIPSTGLYRGIGSRPLVIVSVGQFTISGQLTVGSLRGAPAGAGASDQPCQGLGAAQADNGGGGGGAGGSFAGAGGPGGDGDLNDNGSPTGQAPGGTAAAAAAPTVLRAGCRGGTGGSGGGGSTVGVGGRGGGAVYLISGSDIQISGRVSASGAGGGPGDEQGGGGGGGSGGMIGLDAPAVFVSGFVTANGGGGGEGGGRFGPLGAPGLDGTTDDSRAPGGIAPVNDGNDTDGGNGGVGSGGAELGGGDGDANNGGGGGGGGAAGFIDVKGVLQSTGTVSPAAAVTP
jgi:hypothetical protein